MKGTTEMVKYDTVLIRYGELSTKGKNRKDFIRKLEKKNVKKGESSAHSKISDDNIIKKINSKYLESVRNWLNKSFIDDNGHFEDLEERKKSNKKLFLKISPKIITTKLKKACMMNTMKLKFKNIFYKNNLLKNIKY